MDDLEIVVPMQVAARSLTAAGLAAWVFQHNGRDEDALACGDLQDVVDSALRLGNRDHVVVARSLVEQSARLWVEAAELLEGWAGGDPTGRAEEQRQIARLRYRARSLRVLLRSE